MKTVAFIPVRGGSKSIPKKNIKLLGGRPLVHWVMDAALKCQSIDQVFVASDDPKIREVASRMVSLKLSVLDRDPKTATDEATTESALLEFAEKHQFEKVVLIQATSPYLKSEDLEGALKKMDSSTDSLLSVTKQHIFLWKKSDHGLVVPQNYNPTKRPRRQDWAGELVENGAFYITKRDNLIKSKCRISGNTGFWEMPADRSLEIDEKSDWDLADAKINLILPVDALENKFKKIRLLITDVDGVLTDSGMYYGKDGDALKKFNTRDGMGIDLWQKAGKQIAIMTGEDSQIVAKRAEKLRIKNVMMGITDKDECFKNLLEKLNVTPEETAYIGDDINDLPALKLAGLAVCPSDASLENKKLAHFICHAKGGHGCLRELIDLLLSGKD